jgi:hypothetical protein
MARAVLNLMDKLWQVLINQSKIVIPNAPIVIVPKPQGKKSNYSNA